MILEEMKERFGCREIYVSTDPENTAGIHIYEKFGFVPDESTNQDEDDDEQ